MKMYKKSDLTIIDGMLVNKDQDIVVPNQDVIIQANELEDLIQQHQYLSEQPAAQPMPSLDGFQRKSIRDDSDKVFNAVTPLMDFKAAEAMALMSELDDITSAGVANDLLAKFDKLAQFTKNDYVIDCGADGLLLVFDTPVLGNVLELTYDELCAKVAMLVGFTPDDELEELGVDDEDIEALKDFLSDDGTKKENGTDVVSSLADLAQDVNDLCSDIEE